MANKPTIPNLTFADAAALFGVSVSLLRQLAAKRVISSTRIGRHSFFDQAELQRELLARGRRQAVSA